MSTPNRKPRGIRLNPTAGQDLPLPYLPASRYEPGREYELSVGDLIPDPTQPRKRFEPAALANLAQSLRTAGQQHAIRFRERHDPPPDEPPLILVDGERRWRAAQLADLPTIRGILDREPDSGAELICRQILLNEPGQPLSAWDFVRIFDYLVRVYGKTSAQIAAMLAANHDPNSGKPWASSQIRNYRRLLALPDWAQTLIAEDLLTPTHGLYILPHLEQPRVLAELQQWLTAACRPPAPGAAPAPPLDADGTDPDEPPPDPPEPAAPPTVASLRRVIEQAYEHLYFRLGGYKYIGGTGITCQFPWNAPESACLPCPRRANIDTLHGRASFCQDTDCLQLRNNLHLTATKTAARVALEQAEQAEQSPDPVAPPAESTHRLNRARAALNRANYEQGRAWANAQKPALIRAARTLSVTRLTALILWRLLPYPHGWSDETKRSTLADINARLTGQHNTQWLARLFAGLLDGDQNPELVREIAEYLGLELLDTPEDAP